LGNRRAAREVPKSETSSHLSPPSSSGFVFDEPDDDEVI
jgi:hypothetical protein